MRSPVRNAALSRCSHPPDGDQLKPHEQRPQIRPCRPGSTHIHRFSHRAPHTETNTRYFASALPRTHHPASTKVQQRHCILGSAKLTPDWAYRIRSTAQTTRRGSSPTHECSCTLTTGPAHLSPMSMQRAQRQARSYAHSFGATCSSRFTSDADACVESEWTATLSSPSPTAHVAEPQRDHYTVVRPPLMRAGTRCYFPIHRGAARPGLFA